MTSTQSFREHNLLVFGSNTPLRKKELPANPNTFTTTVGDLLSNNDSVSLQQEFKSKHLSKSVLFLQKQVSYLKSKVEFYEQNFTRLFELVDTHSKMIQQIDYALKREAAEKQLPTFSLKCDMDMGGDSSSITNSIWRKGLKSRPSIANSNRYYTENDLRSIRMAEELEIIKSSVALNNKEIEELGKQLEKSENDMGSRVTEIQEAIKMQVNIIRLIEEKCEQRLADQRRHNTSIMQEGQRLDRSRGDQRNGQRNKNHSSASQTRDGRRKAGKTHDNDMKYEESSKYRLMKDDPEANVRKRYLRTEY